MSWAKAVPVHAMKALGGERSIAPTHSQPRPRFSPGERTPGTHCTGGWVGPRAGLDTEATGNVMSYPRVFSECDFGRVGSLRLFPHTVILTRCWSVRCSSANVQDSECGVSQYHQEAPSVYTVPVCIHCYKGRKAHKNYSNEMKKSQRGEW
jgi:hypothetical protein